MSFLSYFSCGPKPSLVHMAGRHNALITFADIQPPPGEKAWGSSSLPRPWAAIISKQQAEERHAGPVIAARGRARRRRESGPRGDCICCIRKTLCSSAAASEMCAPATAAREWKASGSHFGSPLKICDETRFQCHAVLDFKDSDGICVGFSFSCKIYTYIYIIYKNYRQICECVSKQVPRPHQKNNCPKRIIGE